ncbi:Hypothetical_protein [Hexamita inflata]|uniref:Hypothetical_protein n=1 Tax=Hexamita inflata TaxID=28002 RepID=A0ABP1HH75_9EUKA
MATLEQKIQILFQFIDCQNNIQQNEKLAFKKYYNPSIGYSIVDNHEDHLSCYQRQFYLVLCCSSNKKIIPKNFAFHSACFLEASFKVILEKLVKSQQKVGQNEQKAITDAKQETEPSLTKAQKKKLQMEYQKQFIQQKRAKKDIKAAKPQEKVNLPPAIYPEIRNLQNQINQEGPQVPNQVNETMHQRQPPPSNANTTEQPPCKPKEITSKEKLRCENLFLDIKLANQVKLVY